MLTEGAASCADCPANHYFVPSFGICVTCENNSNDPITPETAPSVEPPVEFCGAPGGGYGGYGGYGGDDRRLQAAGGSGGDSGEAVCNPEMQGDGHCDDACFSEEHLWDCGETVAGFQQKCDCLSRDGHAPFRVMPNPRDCYYEAFYS